MPRADGWIETMKLSDVVDTRSTGYRELEERAHLKSVAAGVRTARVERLAAASGASAEAAGAILEVIAAAPGEFGIAVAPEPVRAVKVKQTPGMIRNIRTNMRDLLLAYESLSKILPDAERTELRDPIYHATEALERMGRPNVTD